MTMVEADHLGRLFRERVRISAAKQALTHQVDGVRRHLTWAELGMRVSRLAEVLSALGAGPGDRVALLAENSLDWICVDLAIHSLNAIHVPIHASLTGHQAAYQMLHAMARVVVTSTPAQAEKLSSLCFGDWEALAETAEAPLQDFRSQVRFASLSKVDSLILNRPVVQLHATPEAGGDVESGALKNFLGQLEPDLTAAKSSDLATILYTSGTTGEPKGVMLTHDNLTSNAVSAVKQLGEMDTDLRLNYLPLSHVFARTCDLYAWIVAGSRLELARSRETAIADLRAAAPTLLSTVPFFLERIYRYLAENQLLDHPNAAREMMGGNLRMVCSGGAALPNYLYDYFNERGVAVFQGYGLSETSPIISCCGPGRDRRGSAGRPIPGVEVKIADDGEICTRGPHVMPGYYRNEISTKDVLKEGWFHTGDLGRIDEDGFLYITGRKKEIIVLSNGKNISPVLIEGLLMRDPLIAQVAIFGDGHNTLAALIVPNFERLKLELGNGAEPSDLKSDSCCELFRKILSDRLTTLSPHEQIKAFALLERPFSIDAGELTPKLSMRRSVIAARYRQILDSLYEKRS
jgi:long-chain acyl-CoA synthetase